MLVLHNSGRVLRANSRESIFPFVHGRNFIFFFFFFTLQTRLGFLQPPFRGTALSQYGSGSTRDARSLTQLALAALEIFKYSKIYIFFPFHIFFTLTVKS